MKRENRSDNMYSKLRNNAKIIIAKYVKTGSLLQMADHAVLKCGEKS